MAVEFTTHGGCTVRLFDRHVDGMVEGTFLAFDMGPTDGRYAEVHLSPGDLDSLRLALGGPRIAAAVTFAEGKANSAMARGDYDERRAWLDLLILLGAS